MLFDIALDPFELNDLASAHPERVTMMTADLEHWFEDVEQDRHHSFLARASEEPLRATPAAATTKP